MRVTNRFRVKSIFIFDKKKIYVSVCEIVAFGGSVQCGTEIAPIDTFVWHWNTFSVTILML